MNYTKEFDFNRSRAVTGKEVKAARRAIEKKLGVKRPSRGRPPKKLSNRYRSISIRVHPRALRWARSEAHKRGVGYQTVINEVLLQNSSHQKIKKLVAA